MLLCAKGQQGAIGCCDRAPRLFTGPPVCHIDEWQANGKKVVAITADGGCAEFLEDVAMLTAANACKASFSLVQVPCAGAQVSASLRLLSAATAWPQTGRCPENTQHSSCMASRVSLQQAW